MPFYGHSFSLQAFNFEAVVPSDDSADNFKNTNSEGVEVVSHRAIYVGQTGDVSVVGYGTDGTDGNTVTFSNVPQGSTLPVRVVRVNATGTTAALLLSLY